MSKFTFICEEQQFPFGDNIPTKRTVEFNAVSLIDILQEFEYFLKGAGFFIDGTLDVLPEEKWLNEDNDGIEEYETPHTELYDSMDVLHANHSKHYFDTERNK